MLIVSWGDLCPMRFSSAVDAFHILPPAASSYTAYSSALLSIAQLHKATLFIPVSGAGSSVEDARAADEMFKRTDGRCRTFIQDPETMLDLHDKDRFMALVEKLGFATPKGQMVTSVEEAMAFLEKDKADGPKYILKCMGLDENRGDMTLYPIKRSREEKRTAEQDVDERRAGVDMAETRQRLEGLKLGISEECPYVFQEFIPGQGEWFGFGSGPPTFLSPSVVYSEHAQVRGDPVPSATRHPLPVPSAHMRQPR